MATIDPTAREANVLARINTYLNGLSVHGAPKLVLIGENGFVPQRNNPFVRFDWTAISSRDAGRHSATQVATRVDKLLTADVFYADGTERDPHNAYDIVRAADDVAHGLRRMNLDLQDYSDTPAAPTAVTGVRIRALDPPDTTPLPSSDGWARYRVKVPVTWDLRHTA